MIASAQTIRHIRPVYPFCERSRAFGMSYGLGSAGYDVRIAEDMILWPFIPRLASTIEHFRIPNNMTMRVQDKSSWARKFVHAFNTNAEPGWRGFLTLELVNLSLVPRRLKRGMPIVNIMFEFLDSETEQPYEGRYQDQAAGPVKAMDMTDVHR